MLLRALLLIVLAFAPAAAEARHGRPNVIVILADDLGVQDVGAYGHRSAVPTPNIDKLAARGVRFDRGYATAPVCSPSRAALMSGRYQQRQGFEYLIPERQNEGGGAPGLDPEQRILPEALKGRGYRTAAVGKWHLGDTPDRLPTARGFDSFFGFLPGEIAYMDRSRPGLTSVPAPYLGERSFTRRLDYTKVGRWRAGSTTRELVANDDSYLTEELTREAVAFIDANRRRPYFLYLAHLAPHSPFQATTKYLDRFPNERDPLKRTYAAMVSALDDSVGEVMAAVEASGRADNTIIVFSADNGAATYMNVSDCTGAIAGGKLAMWEGGVRVPLIVSWPARWPKGVVEKRNVSLMDVAPTIVAAAGAAADPASDGVDLSPRVAGADRDAPIHDTLFWRLGHEYAVLQGDTKLISNTRPGAFPWLLDLASDPGETRNQLFGQRAKAADLVARYKRWSAGLRDPAWPSKETLQVFHCGRISFNDQ